ncbi:MAG: NAD(+)/NADH kinase [Bacilli bacterium]|nr:NAD(+)/NADH kinase [Bacilli bacterium]
MKIGLYYKEKNKENALFLKEQLEKNGFTLDNVNPDVIFSIGGDGTFLQAVHAYINKLDSIKFIGINYGSLGFFCGYTKEDIPELIKELKGELFVKQYSLLKGEIKYQNSEQDIYALNEIRIENPFHTLISDVFIDDEKLETFRGNGLMVCSSLGSSAYNKSLGGSLIDSDLNVLELTEIAGLDNNIFHSLKSSLVVNGNKKISFKGDLSSIVVGYDNLSMQKEDNLLEVTISISDKKVNIVYSKNNSYIKKIRKSFVL